MVQFVEPNLPFYRPLADQTPKLMLERLTDLVTYTWAITDAVSNFNPWKTINPWALMLASQPTAGLVSQFTYFRADLEIYVRLNTNQFYQGAIMVSALPFNAITNNNVAENYLQARSWLKPKVISAQKQDTLAIQLPWTMAQRFITPATIGVGDIPWTVFLDVLTPLRVANPNAPSSIQLNLQARWVNPELMFPYLAATPQSGKSVPVDRPRMRTKKGNRVVVAQNTSRKGPVAQAQSQPKPEERSIAGTIAAEIGGLIGQFGNISSMVEKLQPLLPIAMQMLAMLDKPEAELEVTKVFNTGGGNISTCDTPDQALPLTLYRTSYAAIDPEIMPDGKAWTMLDIAMTPAIHAILSFTAPGSLSAVVPYFKFGTPQNAIMSQHTTWRGSMRMMFQFFCSSFVSARFLIQIAPTSGGMPAGMATNLTRLVDVKGDTVLTVTFPFISPTDMLFSGVSPYNIFISVYNNIISTDTTTDPYIDCVVWSAGGPDSQFSTPIAGDFDYDHLGAVFLPDDPRIVPQCDIVAEFQSPFNPFVLGSSYMTDQHMVTSETTMYVTDVLKRYVPYQTNVDSWKTNTTSTFSANPMYGPEYLSLPWFFANMFAFHRGGLKYKVVMNPTTGARPTFAEAHAFPAQWTAAGNGYGHAWTINTPSENEIDVATPYVSLYPFMQYSTNYFDGQVAYHQPYMWTTINLADSTLTYANSVYNVLTAYRDDVQLGFLIPPPVTADASAKRRRNVKKPGKSELFEFL